MRLRKSEKELNREFEQRAHLPEPADEQFERILERVRAEESVPAPKPKNRWKIWTFVASACACCLAVAFTLYATMWKEQIRYSDSGTDEFIEVPIETVADRLDGFNFELNSMNLSTVKVKENDAGELSSAKFIYDYVLDDFRMSLQMALRVWYVFDLTENHDDYFGYRDASLERSFTVGDVVVLYHEQSANYNYSIDAKAKFNLGDVTCLIDFRFFELEGNVNGQALQLLVSDLLNLSQHTGEMWYGQELMEME